MLAVLFQKQLTSNQVSEAAPVYTIMPPCIECAMLLLLHWTTLLLMSWMLLPPNHES